MFMCCPFIYKGATHHSTFGIGDANCPNLPWFDEALAVIAEDGAGHVAAIALIGDDGLISVSGEFTIVLAPRLACLTLH